MSIIEIFATIFGLISVYLMGKENIWTWPTGIIMVFLYIFIFFDARLYSDMGLQVFYVFMQIYGWYHWKKGNKDRGKNLEVTRLSYFKIFVWLVTIMVGTFVLGYVMSNYTNADFAYTDAFIAVASLAAQWFLTKKFLESWLIWIVVDMVAINVYFLKALYFTAGLYVVFLILAILGFFNWYKSFKFTCAKKMHLQKA